MIRSKDEQPLVCPICSSYNNREFVVKNYIARNILLGDVVVPNINQWCCINCGETAAIDFVSAGAIEKYVNVEIAKAIAALPIGMFVYIKTARTILGLDNADKETKAKFNRRNKNGFIIKIKVSGNWMYYVPSLEAYKECSDGRFLIRPLYSYQMSTSTSQGR